MNGSAERRSGGGLKGLLVLERSKVCLFGGTDDLINTGFGAKIAQRCEKREGLWRKPRGNEDPFFLGGARAKMLLINVVVWV